MKPLTAILFLVVLATRAQASTSSKNFRCWADPGFYGVLKIDVEEKLACLAGFDGQHYDCDDKAVAINPLLETKTTQTSFFGETVEATSFHVQSQDRSKDATMVVYLKEFPRPDFPKHMVSPADLSMNSPFWPYAFRWTKKPDGHFANGELYCLSERYFVSAP